MDIVISTGFQPVIHEISFDPAKIQKGKLLAQKNVRLVREMTGVGSDRRITSKRIKTTGTSLKTSYLVTLDVSNMQH